MSNDRYYMVKTSVLPAVFDGVMRAKELLASGEATSSAQAARMAGISRSAFYKYKDCVFLIGQGSVGRIVNINAVLKDKAGVLSSFITQLYRSGANVVTVNQGIPINGVAQVSVSVRLPADVTDSEMLVSALATTEGVTSVNLVMTE